MWIQLPYHLYAPPGSWSGRRWLLLIEEWNTDVALLCCWFLSVMPSSIQWNLGTQQFTNEKLSLKELKWSSPTTNYPTSDWKQHYNSLSSINNSNHKPNSAKLDTIYYKTHSQLNMRTIINQWNQTFYNVNNCCKVLSMLFLSWI